MIGAIKVVVITITTIPALKEFDKAPVVTPKPANTNPTSPLGIIPAPIANLFIGLSVNTKKPATILPTIAVTIKQAAIIKPL